MTVVIVGGGPSGLTAALAAANKHSDIILFNKNPQPGKKVSAIPISELYFSEKIPPKNMAEQFGAKADFASAVFKTFNYINLIEFFKAINLDLQADANGHFKANGTTGGQLCDHLLQALLNKGVDHKKSARVTDIVTDDNQITGVIANGAVFPASKVILATGSFSSPKYGATRDGYEISQRLGHRIAELKPALVDLITSEKYGKILDGITLDDIRINIFYDGKTAHSEVGSIKFTKTGISGPFILNHSAEIIEKLQSCQVEVRLDLMPDEPRETFDSWLIKEFISRRHIMVGQFLSRYFDDNVIKAIELESRVMLNKSIAHVTNLERKSLTHAIKDFRLTIKSPMPFNSTRGVLGGVAINDIDPETMQSKKIKGLYFAGDIIDVLGPFGGYNMQFAFSSGYIAGSAAAGLN